MRKWVATGVALAFSMVAWDATGKTLEADSAASLKEAVSVVQPGDEIILADGLYEGLNVTLTGKASADAPITLRAQTPGGVILTKSGRIRIEGEYLIVSGFVFDQVWQGASIVHFDKARHCRFTECAFVDCGDPFNTFRHIVTLRTGSCFNRLDHCFMKGNLSMGMGIAVGTETTRNTDNRIDHNWYLDIRRRSNNGQEAIQLAHPGRTVDVRAVVEYNLFEATNGDAEIISDKSCSNTIRYNTFRDSRSQLVLRDGSRTLVQGNIFLNTGGIRMYGDHHRILDNYLANCRSSAILMSGGGSIASGRHLYMNNEDNLVAGNTIVNSARAGLDIGRLNPHPAVTQHSRMCNNRYERNLIADSKGTLILDGGSINSTWVDNVLVPTGEAVPGLEQEGIRKADIQLTEQDGCLFPPAGLGAGCAREALGEYGRPLAPSDVGPSWLQGDLTRLHRIPEPQPVPDYAAGKKRQEAMFTLRATSASPLKLEKDNAGACTVQLEDCLVSDGAVVADLGDGARGVRFLKTESRVEARLSLPAGFYRAMVYAYAADSDADAFYVVINRSKIRTYPEEQNAISLCKRHVEFTAEDDEPVSLIVVPAEAGVAVDRIEISPAAK